MDVQQIKQLLQYDPQTGQLTWAVGRTGAAGAGTIAGTVANTGYLRVSLQRRKYQAHRLAWLLAYGDWPNGDIDHINGDKLDNRLTNLRVVNHRQNMQNQSVHRKGRLHGCYYNKRDKRWQARIRTREVRHHLGFYATEQEAHEAYLHALQEMTK